jgi:hypothetical protein
MTLAVLGAFLGLLVLLTAPDAARLPRRRTRPGCSAAGRGPRGLAASG